MKRIYTPAKPKKILIVDDDETVASAYRDKLQSERFTVEVASSGERALQSLAKEPVDLVILDFSLPGMNGAEILKTIRSQFGATALPIIVSMSDFETEYQARLIADFLASAPQRLGRMRLSHHALVNQRT